MIYIALLVLLAQLINTDLFCMDNNKRSHATDSAEGPAAKKIKTDNQPATQLLTCANGTYAAAQTEVNGHGYAAAGTASHMRISNSPARTAAAVHKAGSTESLQDRILTQLAATFDHLIASDNFNGTQIAEIEKTYAAQIKKKLAQMVTDKHRALLNTVTKPGIETVFQTGIAPVVSDLFEKEQFEKKYKEKFYQKTPLEHAKKLLSNVGIEIAGFWRHEEQDAIALIQDIKGNLYLHNVHTLVTKKCGVMNREHAVINFDYSEGAQKVFLVATSPNNKDSKTQLPNLDLIIFDLRNQSGITMRINDVNARLVRSFLAYNGNFCLVTLSTGTTIITRIDTLNSRSVYGAFRGDKEYRADHILLCDLRNPAAVNKYIDIKFKEFPQFDPHETEKQYTTTFVDETEIETEYLLFNHRKTYALKKDSKNQLWLYNLKTAQITALGNLATSRTISTAVRGEMFHFDYHEQSGQLILMIQSSESEAPVLQLIHTKTKIMPETYKLPQDDNEIITYIIFNADASYCLLEQKTEAWDPDAQDTYDVLCINLKTKTEISIPGSLCGPPTSQYAAIRHTLNKAEKYQPHVKLLHFATQHVENLMDFACPEKLDTYVKREGEVGHFWQAESSPNGKYLVATYGDASERTLKDCMRLWNLPTYDFSTFVIDQPEQDSFMQRISFNNDTYLLGVCNKGYLYVGNVVTKKLRQLQRSRKLPQGNTLVRAYTDTILFSPDKQQVYIHGDAEFFDKRKPDGYPEETEDRTDAIANFETREFSHIYDFENANFAYVASMLTLPQLLMIARLVQKNHYFTQSYKPVIDELHPYLKELIPPYILKKTVTNWIPTLDVAQIAIDYAQEDEKSSSSRSSTVSIEPDEKADH